MKALHEFICQKHNNNRKAPSLQADIKIPMNTMAGMCQKSRHAALSTNGISQREVWLQLCHGPTQGFIAEAVNHLCITMMRVFVVAAPATVVKNKNQVSLSQGIASTKYLLHSEDGKCVLGAGEVRGRALNARFCAGFSNSSHGRCPWSGLPVQLSLPALLLGLYPLTITSCLSFTGN